MEAFKEEAEQTRERNSYKDLRDVENNIFLRLAALEGGKNLLNQIMRMLSRLLLLKASRMSLPISRRLSALK
jgi:hypothetical protein